MRNNDKRPGARRPMPMMLTLILLALLVLGGCDAPNHAGHDHAGDDHGHASHDDDGQNDHHQNKIDQNNLGHEDHGDQDGHGGHGHHDEARVPTGPNGGRALRDGDVMVELRIFEDGVPPEWRGWVYRRESLLPDAGTLSVTTTRLGGEAARDRLAPTGSVRRGQLVVGEPHSFVVDVELELDDRRYQWQFDSFEGRTQIGRDMADRMGIVTRTAGPATLRERHEAFGLLTLVEGRHARIGARFDGMVLDVGAGVGELVEQGQRLAVIESNRGLSEYPLVSPLDGVVLRREIEPGEVIVTGAEAFEVADLSTLWVDLHVFGVDADRLKPGLPMRIRDVGRTRQRDTRIERILPMTASASQSTIARGVLDNADGHWRPGSAILAEVTLDEIPVDLAVPLSAIQIWRDRDVVFQRIDGVYEVRPVQLGRRDGVHAEVLAGLAPGAEIVVEQSFLIKADIEKSGATHDH